MHLELKLRKREHVELFWEKTQKESIQKIFPSSIKTKEEAITLFEKSLKPDSSSYGKVIYVDDRYVGDIWCFGVDEDEEKLAMISIVIFDVTSHGKGIGTRCLQEFSKEIFQQYKIDKLGAFVFSDNVPSIKMLHKAGFEEIEEFLEDGRLSKYFEVKRTADKRNIEKKKGLHEMNSEELGRLFPIHLTAHDPSWRGAYEEEERQLLGAVNKEELYRLQHIGSTSVPGLFAKPTIDILLEIHQNVNTDAFIEKIKALGYLYNHQPSNPAPHMMFMKGYTEEGFKGQAVHLHVRYPGDWNELYFRDYLIAYPDIAEEYGQLKKKLKETFEFDRDGYTSAKTEFIKKVTDAARAEYKNRYDVK